MSVEGVDFGATWGMPKQRGVFPLSGGWKSSTLYEVRVAFNRCNPMHTAIFYSGFVKDGIPGGYNQIWSPSYERERYDLSDAYRLIAIREL